MSEEKDQAPEVNAAAPTTVVKAVIASDVCEAVENCGCQPN